MQAQLERAKELSDGDGSRLEQRVKDVILERDELAEQLAESQAQLMGTGTSVKELKHNLTTRTQERDELHNLVDRLQVIN